MNVILKHGDCRKLLKTLPDNSIDSIVCDPPYDLTANKKGGSGPASASNITPAGRAKIGTGFMGKSWDATGVAFEVATWQECLRVLKPGGHLLAFGGTRTHHRMTCAIEDAGFEIRDELDWLYGCLSDDTEILTSTGWMRNSREILNSLVMCFDPTTHTFFYEQPRDYYDYENAHTAYRIHSDTTDQLVSRNHRVLVERAGELVFEFAETLAREQQACVPILEGVPNVCGTQTLRGTVARIDPVDYRGHVWCVSVSSGAFVARRRGMMFVTGNSGFPKSMNVSKAIDRQAGHVRQSESMPNHKNKVYGAGMGGGEWNAPSDPPVTDAARQWSGWGTALKPAREPIVLARKPFGVSLSVNIQEHGTGAINVNACRIGTGTGEPPSERLPNFKNNVYGKGMGGCTEDKSKGRWPANVLMTHSPDCVPVGSRSVPGYTINRWDDGSKPFGNGAGHPFTSEQQPDEVVEVYRCVADCPVRMLNEQSGVTESGDPRADRGTGGIWHKGSNVPCGPQHGDSGGASRFFYVAKAPRTEREAGCEHLPVKTTTETVDRDPNSAGVRSPRAGAGRGAGAPLLRCTVCGHDGGGAAYVSPCLQGDAHTFEVVGTGDGVHNHHPTVKPILLMRYLCKLITPPGGVVLDPFMGSGSTGCGAVQEGFRFIGFDLTAEYVEIAAARIAYWQTHKHKNETPLAKALDAASEASLF